jgi:hypothetical protein
MAGWLSKAYCNGSTLWHARDEGRLPYRALGETLAVQNQRVMAIVAHGSETVPYYRVSLKIDAQQGTLVTPRHYHDPYERTS